MKSDMYQTLHVTPEKNTSMPIKFPILRNTCYYIILNDEEFIVERLQSMVNLVVKEFKHPPSLVVVFSNNWRQLSPMTSTTTSMTSLTTSTISSTWVTITDLRKVSIACPNCDDIKHGFWNHPSPLIKQVIGHFSSNFHHPVCKNHLEGRKF